MADETASPGHSVKAGTEYLVLEQLTRPGQNELSASMPMPGTWREVGSYTATSPKAAMEAYVRTVKQTDTVPTLVAVALRHWSPVTPKADVVTTWTFEAAS